jgi:hypothetical protein
MLTLVNPEQFKRVILTETLVWFSFCYLVDLSRRRVLSTKVLALGKAGPGLQPDH